MKTLKLFFRSVAAGIMIAIGGTVYLSCDNKYIGSLLFAVGLFSIVTRGYALFTGAVGYFFSVGGEGKLELPVIWLGNLAGTSLSALLLKLTRISGTIGEKAAKLCETKLADSLLSVFVLAIFCGMLMYLAVDSFRNQQKTLIRVVPVFVCVSVFILCGFEHCVANMFYFAVGGGYAGVLAGDLRSIISLLVMTVGNGVGAIILDLIKKSSAPKKEG